MEESKLSVPVRQKSHLRYRFPLSDENGTASIPLLFTGMGERRIEETVWGVGMTVVPFSAMASPLRKSDGGKLETGMRLRLEDGLKGDNTLIRQRCFHLLELAHVE